MNVQVREDRGNKETFITIAGMEGITDRAVRHGLFSYMRSLHSEANAASQTNDKTGKTYTIRGPKGRKRRHRSSSPGQSHANMRGNLRRSTGYKVSGSRESEFGYGIASRKDEDAPVYAAAIELGRPAGVSARGRKYGAIAERPTLQNTVDRVEGESHFIEALDIELRRKGLV